MLRIAAAVPILSNRTVFQARQIADRNVTIPATPDLSPDSREFAPINVHRPKSYDSGYVDFRESSIQRG
jgi:hypothetical protein